MFSKILDFEVVRNGGRIEKMKEIDDDEITGVTRGKEIFNHNICNKCLNTKKSDASDSLKTQKVYQMTRTQNHKMNKPILATNVNER